MGLSSLRVMATCATMGQAVGTAAAIALRDGLDPAGVRKDRIAELQDTLEDDDCMLPYRWRKVSALTRAATVDPANGNLRNGIDRGWKKADNGVWVNAGDETLVYSWASPQRQPPGPSWRMSPSRGATRGPCACRRCRARRTSGSAR